MHIHDDFTQPVLIHTAELPWTPSPVPGVERKMLDRVGGEVARATSQHTPRSDQGCLIFVKLWQFDPTDRHACRRQFPQSLPSDALAHQTHPLYKDDREQVTLPNTHPALGCKQLKRPLLGILSIRSLFSSKIELNYS